MSVVRLTTDAGAWGPVSLMEARDYARLVVPDDDVTMQRLMEAAVAEIERYSGLVLVPGTFRVSWDAWVRRLEVPIVPVTAVTSVSYQAEDGTTEVLGGTDYLADLGTLPARLTFTAHYGPWGLRGSSGIEAVVSAGYASVTEVPADVQQHVLDAALLMFDHRGDVAATREIHAHIARVGMSLSTMRLA